MKKNIIIFLSILLLVIIIGILFYFYDKKSSSKDIVELANTYSKNPVVDDQNTCIISLNYTKSLRDVITSILEQDIRVHTIYVNKNNVDISKKEEWVNILKDMNVIKLHNNEKDFGKLNNIIPTVGKQKKSNTVILFLKDNFMLPTKNFSKNYFKNYIKNTNNNIVYCIKSTLTNNISKPDDPTCQDISDCNIMTYIDNINIDIILKNEKIVDECPINKILKEDINIRFINL
jgi:hypothetical protein